MNRSQLAKEVARKSKYGERPLTVLQVKDCIELIEETIKETVSTGEEIRLENFLKIEIFELKSRKIQNVHTKEIDLTRDLKVPRVRLSLNFINDVKQNLNEDMGAFYGDSFFNEENNYG